MKGWHNEPQAHALASKGIRTSIQINACGEQLKKEYVILDKSAYSDNKVKIKKIFKDMGLEFDKPEYFKSNKFIWKNDKERIELINEDDKAVLHWESSEESELLQKLKEETEKLDGVWVSKDTDSEAGKVELGNDLKKFDSRNMSLFIENERNARMRGFKHCPILKAMINEYIENRDKEFGATDKHQEEILKYVIDYIDTTYPELKEKYKGGIIR